ncbi:MAG TPA: archaemetzincin family Zn-dependent metalloprotease [Bryobacteraceae bacterium]|nr:archaemetzincin family Zn-dependent metalloprotease [Bryobacteraceae bacterium]
MSTAALHILIVPAGVEREVAASLAPGLQSAFGHPCSLSERALDARGALDAYRRQHRSTVLLEMLETNFTDWRVLGVAAVDLFVPVLTFVFGEAQVGGRCAVISTHRLREEAYGLPSHPALLSERLLKEAVHELGHTFGLRHCDDWTCAMHSSHAVEAIDLKTARLCEQCRMRLGRQ